MSPGAAYGKGNGSWREFPRHELASMAHLKYHQSVLDLLGIHLDLPARRLAIMEEREKACGQHFPASVREWFSIGAAETLFNENTNDDHLVELTELGDPAEVAQGYLRVATENQGVVAWYVRLAEGDDPPVYNNNDEWNEDLSKTGWQEHSTRFTSFIFDMISSHHFDGWFTGMRLSAIARQPSPDELRQLRSWFHEGPVTDTLDSKVHRFFTLAGLLTVRSVTAENPANSQAEWAIEANSADELFEFGKKLWRFGSLSGTLKAESCTPESRANGEQVLRRIRAWAGG